MKGVWDARWLGTRWVEVSSSSLRDRLWSSGSLMAMLVLVSPLVPPQSFQVREERGVWRENSSYHFSCNYH